MVCVLTGNDATGWRCHVLYQSLVRWGFFFFHSMFICHFIFLFPDSLSDHPHLPPSQHFCPHKFTERIDGFLLYMMDVLSISVTLSTASYFLYFCSVYLRSPSVWPDLRCTLQRASPRFKSQVLLWGRVFEAAVRLRCLWQPAIWRWALICWWFTAKWSLRLARLGHLACAAGGFFCWLQTPNWIISGLCQ